MLGKLLFQREASLFTRNLVSLGLFRSSSASVQTRLLHRSSNVQIKHENSDGHSIVHTPERLFGQQPECEAVKKYESVRQVFRKSLGSLLAYGMKCNSLKRPRTFFISHAHPMRGSQAYADERKHAHWIEQIVRDIKVAHVFAVNDVSFSLTEEEVSVVSNNLKTQLEFNEDQRKLIELISETIFFDKLELQYHGTSLKKEIANKMRSRDEVFIFGTPLFLKKSKERKAFQSGSGVSEYEKYMVAIEVETANAIRSDDSEGRKIKPVLLAGSVKESLPDGMQQGYVDYVNADYFEETFKLFADVYGVSAQDKAYMDVCDGFSKSLKHSDAFGVERKNKTLSSQFPNVNAIKIKDVDGNKIIDFEGIGGRYGSFVGRKSEIKKIDEADPKAVVFLMDDVTSVGGTGKTFLLREYAYQALNKKSFYDVFLLDENTLMEGLGHIRRDYNMKSSQISVHGLEQLFMDTMRRLSYHQNNRFLIIFNKVEHPRRLYETYIKPLVNDQDFRRDTVRFLIDCDNSEHISDKTKDCVVVPLGAFDEEDTRMYIEKRLGGVVDVPSSCITDLWNNTEGFPLGLYVILDFIRHVNSDSTFSSSAMGLAEYNTQFNAHYKDCAKRYQAKDYAVLHAHTRVLMDFFKEDFPAITWLMSHCCLFSHRAFHRDFLLQLFEKDNLKNFGKDDLDNAVNVLLALHVLNEKFSQGSPSPSLVQYTEFQQAIFDEHLLKDRELLVTYFKNVCYMLSKGQSIELESEIMEHFEHLYHCAERFNFPDKKRGRELEYMRIISVKQFLERIYDFDKSDNNSISPTLR